MNNYLDNDNNYSIHQIITISKSVNLNTVRVANNTRPAECDQKDANNNLTFSQTACGFVVEFVDIVEERRINSTRTTAGGWSESEIIAYLNRNFYNILSTDLKNSIIDTNPVISVVLYNPVIINTNDKIYLLAGREVGLELDFTSTIIEENLNKDFDILSFYTKIN